MTVCRMALYLGFMLIFFFSSQFLGLKLNTLGQMQKWRNFRQRRWRWDVGSAPLTVGFNPSPFKLMCRQGGFFSQEEGLGFNLLPSLQVSWLSPGKQTGKEATRLWLPRKASDMQLFSEFLQMMVLFSEIRITQHTLHKQEGINPQDNLFTMNNSTSRSDYSKDRVKS